MDWEKSPEILRDRYRTLSRTDLGPLKIAMLEEMNKHCLPTSQETDSYSYGVFANQFNSTMLMAHFFENLFILEDRRHDLEGYTDFQINIPEIYFRHPSLIGGEQLPEAEKAELSSALRSTKARLNFSKDQSFVLSQLHRLEFISTYSYLEAYVESLMVEFLHTEKEKASDKVARKALPKIMEEVFNKINPDIIQAVNGFEADSLKFISFCRKIRNLHMHDLGVVTKRFFEECAKEDLLCHDTYANTSQPVTDYARPNFRFFDYIIKVGSPINLSGISQSFRLIAREIVFISEAYCKQIQKS